MRENSPFIGKLLLAVVINRIPTPTFSPCRQFVMVSVDAEYDALTSLGSERGGAVGAFM